MWHWIKHWHGWVAMRDLLPTYRNHPHPQALYCRAEKAFWLDSISRLIAGSTSGAAAGVAVPRPKSVK